VWREINHQIKLLEIVRYAMETAVDNAAIPLDDLANASASEDIALKKWLAVQNILHDVLLPVTVQYMADPNDSEESRAEKRIAFMEEPGGMRSRIEKLKGAKGDKRNEGLGNILLDLDRQQRGIIGRLDPQDPIRVAFCGFIIVDSYLFAMERTAGIEAKDVIHTVRISPIDAQRAHSHRTIDKKLCGDALGHFGGFLKASWRANDIMWGRLDGLCQLVECLVSPERIEALASSSRDERLRSTATKRVKPIYDWAQAHQTPLFPGASEQLCSQLRKDIEHLEEYAAKHIETHGKDSRFSDFISRLVEAAQAQILEEEIPRVLDCAITEQNRWNHYSAAPAPDSANPPYSEEKQAWTVGVKKIDPAVLAYAKRELLKKKEAGFWRKYFEDGKYSVGEESVIDGLPTPVLVEMVTHSAIILQNCAARAVGESRAQKIRNSLLYRIGVRYPIRTAYDFAIFQRTAPEYAKFLRTTMGVAASTALAVGVVWWDPLIWRQSVFAGKTFALLIGSPLLTFGLLALFKGVRAVWAALAGIVITVGVVALTHLKVIDLEYLRSIAGAIDVKVFVVGVVAGFVLPVLFRVIRSLIKRKAKATRDKAAGPGPGLGPGPKPPDPPDGEQLKRKAAGQPR
jgi:hypothetical protein